MASQSDPPPPAKDPSPNLVTRDESEQRTTRQWVSASQVEKRRDFTNKQNLRRQVYRNLTVFQMFPLQAMAMDDFDQQLKDYFNADQSAGSDESDLDSDRLCDLRKQFLREFLKDKPTSMLVADDATANPTQHENNSSVAADGGGLDSVEINATNKPSSDDKENLSHQKTIIHSEESDNQAQLKLDHPGEQHKQKQSDIDSVIPSSDQERFQNEGKQQFLSTLWSMEPRIFAMETAMKGKRRYISAHLGRFMDHYWRECDVYNRHYYELIKENTPCRLYFDLEFIKRPNPELTPTITEDLLTELFVELTQQFLLIYNISIQRSCMVDLDSSTPKKFSRHWILHLPKGELFSDAREVGVFVKRLVGRLEEEKESGELQSRGHELLANNLFVNAEDSEGEKTKLTRFIDLGVYTRNRIFRLLGSTKFGKPTDAALRIAEVNEFPFPRGFDNAKFYSPKTSRGLRNDSPANDANGADNDDDFEYFCNSLSWEDHAAAMSATLIVPVNASKMHYPTLNDPSILLSDDEKQQIISLRTINGSRVDTTSRFPRATTKYGTSPFHKLEHFILNTLGKRKGMVGNIGTWSLSTQRPLPQTISYNMKDNRFCDNIERAHKSNNIIWNIHLIDRVCWQSCHDPECRGYRGNPIDLPEEANLEIDEYFLDYELSSVNENELINNKENELVTPEEEREFCDPTLEAEMCQLDISSVAREKETGAALDDEELDDELAKLNLSDIISNNCAISEPLSDVKNQNDDVSNPAMKPKLVNSNASSSEPWENDKLDSALDDEELDDELA
eukprot:CAMPEP_0172308220 /NCGR_PEP_ID=MMETSP1058-20130122/8895_1 /TAXON_ID=83371 /ORGANISM="Detonula confervacea, Strain CCMP 353" /LENGTH=790 /DNA_ID=CAMNT_0013020593 /DNA_START=61 /DNA_END=2430 /DNA_ORIENTATION=+